MPKFNKALLENLCTDRSLVDMDEDDVRAHILTMKTVRNRLWLESDGCKAQTQINIDL